MTNRIVGGLPCALAASAFLITSFLSSPMAEADIFDAAATCDADALRAEIRSGADFNAADDDGNSVLHLAARNSGDDCVEVLLEHKPNLDARNRDGETPFMKTVISSASEEGALRAANLLIDAGADTKMPNKFGYSPLFALVVYGNGMTIILDPALSKPDPQSGIPPYKGGEYDMAKLLLENGADPNARDERGQSVMQFAAELRTPALIDLLASHGGDLQFQEPQQQRSLLHLAAQRDRLINIPYLLKHGLDINGKDAKGATPLMLAVAFQRPEMVKALLEAGAEADIPDVDGFPPLVSAANDQMPDMIEALLDNGANPDVKTSKSHNTALQLAAFKGWREGVELLLKNGADPKATDIRGATALDFARQQGHSEIAALLESRK